MGRLREVCGAVSGMFMVIGLLYGYSDPMDNSAKAEQYAKVQELARRFEEKNGSIVCRELLGLSAERVEDRSEGKSKDKSAAMPRKYDSPVPEVRDAAYYAKRPCPEIVGCAAEILEEFIREN